MEPFSTPSLSFSSVRALVSASDAGAGAGVSLIVFEFSRSLAFRKGAWSPASMKILSNIAMTCFVGSSVF